MIKKTGVAQKQMDGLKKLKELKSAGVNRLDQYEVSDESQFPVHLWFRFILLNYIECGKNLQIKHKYVMLTDSDIMKKIGENFDTFCYRRQFSTDYC